MKIIPLAKATSKFTNVTLQNASTQFALETMSGLKLPSSYFGGRKQAEGFDPRGRCYAIQAKGKGITSALGGDLSDTLVSTKKFKKISDASFPGDCVKSFSAKLSDGTPMTFCLVYAYREATNSHLFYAVQVEASSAVKPSAPRNPDLWAAEAILDAKNSLKGSAFHPLGSWGKTEFNGPVCTIDVRDWGTWEGEAYSQRLSKSSLAYLHKVVDEINARHSGKAVVTFQTGEKNWIYFESRAT